MSQACLTEKQLRAILEGTASSGFLNSAEEHLDICTACQAALETLAGPENDLQALGRAGQFHKVTTVLEQAILDIVAEGPETASPCSRDSEQAAILQFFSPSSYPKSIGRFGSYEILEMVASGGMGTVLKAIEISLDRIVAIKVLAPVLAADPRGRQRFLREARAAAAIRHDNVISIIAVGEANDLPFIAMEFIDDSLAGRLHRDGPLTFEKLLRVAKETTAGLAAAHASGIIHRDIKPGNILIERGTGRAKITDFGLARAMDDTGLTRSGFIAGTPEYLSPEQAAGEPLDARSDLFSLGCLLYAAGVGHSPFHAPSTLAVLRRVADHAPDSLSKINPGIPPWFGRLVERLMAKKPADRFASAEEFLRALDAEGANAQNFVAPASAPPPRRKRQAVAGLITATAVCAALLWWGFVTFAKRAGADGPQTNHSASATAPAIQPNLFAVADSGERRVFKNFESAVAEVPEHGTIELLWTGEQQQAPLILPPKPLTIRPAPGLRPVWLHIGGSNAAITVKTNLTLEDIEFRVLSERETAAAGNGTGTGALLRALGTSVTLNRCVFQQDARDRSHGPAIELMGSCELKLFNSAFYFEASPGVLLSHGLSAENAESQRQSAIAISNSVIKADQAISVASAPGTKVDLRLWQSTFKGGALLLIADGGTDLIAVQVQRNLFALGVLISDQRDPDTLPLARRMTWSDDENLYALDDRLIVSRRVLPGRGPASIREWPWAGQMSERSREGDVFFRKDARGKDEFRVTDIPAEALQGAPLPRTEWSHFGAKLDDVGPSSRNL